MKEYRIEELLHEVDLYRQAIREAQETLAAAERELDAYLTVQLENVPETKLQEERVYTPSGVWYDFEHGCYNDADGHWLVTID